MNKSPGIETQDGSQGLTDAARPGTYYNEWEPFAAQWLRNLAAAPKRDGT